METRLYHIFKSKKATNWTKSILESSYKFLLGTILFVTLKRPVYFLWAIEFLATFNLKIDITMALFLGKLQNNTFQKAFITLSKSARQDSLTYSHPGGNNGLLFEKWKKYDLWWLLLRKIKMSNLESNTALQNMSNGALILKIWGVASHPCSNYGPSNLLFRVSDSFIDHFDKTLRKVSVMLAIPVFESYIKLKALLNVSRILGNQTWNSAPLKLCEVAQKSCCTSNIINFRHIFSLGSAI